MTFFHKFLIKIANFLYPSKVHGLENFNQSNVLICCNHLSMIDVVYLVKNFNKDTYFVAKKEVIENKLFGKLLSSFGGIPIDRENVDIRSLMNIIKILKSGNNLVIFPEGTRNKTGELNLLPFKGGSMVFAVKAKTPILPVIIYKKAKLFRKNHLIIGKPILLTDFYDKTLDNDTVIKMENLVRDKMVELQQNLDEIVNSKKKNKKKVKNW